MNSFKNENPNYPYPFIDCDTHGKQLGYAVCQHVAEKTSPVFHVLRATQKDMGECFCKACAIKAETNSMDLVPFVLLGCEASLTADGLLVPQLN